MIALRARIVTRQKQDFIGWGQQQRGARFGPAGQVIEVRLLSEAEDRVVAFGFSLEQEHSIVE